MLPDGSDTQNSKLPFNASVANLISLTSHIFECLCENDESQVKNSNGKDSNDIFRATNTKSIEDKSQALLNRAVDVISFIVSLGILDKISLYFCRIRGPVNDDSQTEEILTSSLNLLTSLTKFLCLK